MEKNVNQDGERVTIRRCYIAILFTYLIFILFRIQNGYLISISLSCASSSVPGKSVGTESCALRYVGTAWALSPPDFRQFENVYTIIPWFITPLSFLLPKKKKYIISWAHTFCSHLSAANIRKSTVLHSLVRRREVGREVYQNYQIPHKDLSVPRLKSDKDVENLFRRTTARVIHDSNPPLMNRINHPSSRALVSRT